MSLTNNRVLITFTRDFVAGEKFKFNIGDLSTGFGVLYEFVWVATVTSGFEVEVGTPTGTAGETSAINFATAWGNSLTGYEITQAGNQVTITDPNNSFLSVLATDSSDVPLIIPTDYNYAISTFSTGNKITYADKVAVNLPAGDVVNIWRDLDANEVKTKHNLNDDRITTNANNIQSNTNALGDKANLTGGNTFQGDQILEDNLEVQSGITIDNSTVPAQLFLKSPLNNDSAINFIENNVQRSKIGWDDSANLFAIVIGTGAFSAAQVKFFSTIAVLEIDLSLNGNDILNVGSIDAENATFGIEGQSNSISILGDTGENVTITKNTDGTTTFENTNNENIIIEGGLDVNAGAGIFTLDSTNAAPLRITNTGTGTGFRLSDVGGSADLIWENGVGFNLTDDTVVNGFLDTDNISVSAAAPSSASDTGTQGEIRTDADYIYVCTATDTWKRVAIATW